MPDFLSITPMIRKAIYADVLTALLARPKFGTLGAAVLYIDRQIRSEAVKVLKTEIRSTLNAGGLGDVGKKGLGRLYMNLIDAEEMISGDKQAIKIRLHLAARLSSLQCVYGTIEKRRILPSACLGDPEVHESRRRPEQ